MRKNLPLSIRLSNGVNFKERQDQGGVKQIYKNIKPAAIIQKIHQRTAPM